MNLTKLTHNEEDRLRTKVGDLNLFKSKILNSRLNLADFEIYKDMNDPHRSIYIALKHNPRYHAIKTGYSTDSFL
jgi:hypothetical protein